MLVFRSDVRGHQTYSEGLSEATVTTTLVLEAASIASRKVDAMVVAICLVEWIVDDCCRVLCLLKKSGTFNVRAVERKDHSKDQLSPVREARVSLLVTFT